MKALVVGASGQVGGALLEVLGADAVGGTCRRTPIPGGIPLELAGRQADDQAAEELLVRTGADTVFLTAGMTYVDGCEADPSLAMDVNRDAAGAIARAAARHAARVVFFSTEYVFDGGAGPYDEQAEPAPLSVYGQSKLEGERVVLAAGAANLVVRTTIVYGPELQGKNSAYQLVRGVREGRVMRVPVDQLTTPTYNRDLAWATVELARRGRKGVCNVVGAERMSRFEAAVRTVKAAGLDGDAIQPVETHELGQAAARPLQAGLVIARLQEWIPEYRPRSIEEAVADWRCRSRGAEWP